MDKPTRWLRVEVPTALYDEIVKRAKADDRELHVYLRRHLEEAFETKTPFSKMEVIYHGTDGRVTVPWEKFKANIEPKCLLEGATGPMGVACPCPKCAMTCSASSPGLTGESVHGLTSYQKSSCEGGGHVGPCGMNDCTHCNPPKAPGGPDDDLGNIQQTP